MKKKSQIFRNKLELGYILNYFLSNFGQIKPTNIIDISFLEQRYSSMIDSNIIDSCNNDISYNKNVKYSVIHMQLDKVIYRKLNYHNKIHPFVDYIKDFYYESKKNYALKKPTYKSFVTIIRQICKYFGFTMNSTIKYTKSSYDLNYDIYITY